MSFTKEGIIEVLKIARPVIYRKVDEWIESYLKTRKRKRVKFFNVVRRCIELFLDPPRVCYDSGLTLAEISQKLFGSTNIEHRVRAKNVLRYAKRIFEDILGIHLITSRKVGGSWRTYIPCEATDYEILIHTLERLISGLENHIKKLEDREKTMSSKERFEELKKRLQEISKVFAHGGQESANR